MENSVDFDAHGRCEEANILVSRSRIAAEAVFLAVRAWPDRAHPGGAGRTVRRRRVPGVAEVQGPQILGSPEYRIGPEQVEITPQPPWIQQSDIRAEVFRSPDARRSPVDHGRRSHRANRRRLRTSSLGGEESRTRVTKQYGTVKVELVYRKPVCMVEVPGGGLLPVDAEGVLLPTVDFTSPEAARYPRLLGVDRGADRAGGKSLGRRPR